jgi:hypothetical protein
MLHLVCRRYERIVAPSYSGLSTALALKIKAVRSFLHLHAQALLGPECGATILSSSSFSSTAWRWRWCYDPFFIFILKHCLALKVALRSFLHLQSQALSGPEGGATILSSSSISRTVWPWRWRYDPFFILKLKHCLALKTKALRSFLRLQAQALLWPWRWRRYVTSKRNHLRHDMA